MPRTAVLLAALALTAAAPAAAAPGTADRKTVIGQLSVAGCAEDQLPSDCLRPGNPLLLTAANGELHLLHGVEPIDLERLRGLAGGPLAVTGPFGWHGRMRTLRLDLVRAATPEELEAARTVEHEGEMVRYHLTILRPGPAREEIDEARRAELMEGHFAHIREQVASGLLVLAGPFGEQAGEPRMSGLYLYRVDSLERAEALSGEDPAVAAGYFSAETVPWWGPASLGS